MSDRTPEWFEKCRPAVRIGPKSVRRFCAVLGVTEDELTEQTKRLTEQLELQTPPNYGLNKDAEWFDYGLNKDAEWFDGE